MSAIITRVGEIEQSLKRVLERERCTSDQGCSALANVLLEALVKCRKDPRVTAAVSEEMRKLAAKLTELSLAGSDVDRILDGARLH